MSSYEITESDVASYWQRGYWISPKLIDDDRIDRLRNAMFQLFEGKYDGHGSLFNGQQSQPNDVKSMKRVINAWWVNDEIHAMVLGPMIGQITAALMKVDRVRLFSDQVILKPSESDSSGNVGWHQDAAYWHINSARQNMVTAWIALQDTDLSNGGMRTIVGSHKWGMMDDSDMFYDSDLAAQKKYFAGRGDGSWTDEPCILKAGQVSFHHSLCFHGSEANTSDQHRMSVIGHYMPDGAIFEPSGRFQIFLPLMGPNPIPGMALTEPIFPQVYPS